MKKILLLWNMFDDGLVPYLLDEDHIMAKAAAACNEVHINVTEVEDDHPIWKLYAWLDTDEANALKSEFPLAGNITAVYHSGFAS